MRPDFTTLWNSYPPYPDPPACDGAWANQCAIRMSIALNAEGSIVIDRNTYSEPKCAHGHARGAESLANFLWRRVGRPRVFDDGARAKIAVVGKSGIIFFKDCFTREGERTARGDHIDLWRLGSTKSYSDPSNAAKKVWFWELA